MKQKNFTFLYIPSENAVPKPIRIPKVAAYSAMTLALLMTGIATWAVVKYHGKIRQTYRLATVERQNEQLREQLTGLTADVDELRRDVHQNFDFQKKARILANLDDLPEDVQEVGVGGPSFTYIQSLSHLDEATRESVLGAKNDVDKMLRQARLQSESYEEILTNLNESADILRHTPSLRPVNVGFVSSRYGWRMDPINGRRQMHRGLDFSARKGTPVFAPADGVVTFSGNWKTYGKVVEISHGHGFVTRFAHLEKQLVKKGQKIKRGDTIGRVGQTGRSTFTHLHYEVEKDGQRVNPAKYIISG